MAREYKDQSATVVANFRLRPEQKDALKTIAKRERTNLSALYLMGVDWVLAEYQRTGKIPTHSTGKES